MESLEPRVLLAGDMPAWQNPVLAEDVNGDAVVALDDVLLIANELHDTGPRALLAPSQVGAASFTAAASEAASTAGAEGEQPPPLYVDVNGDNYLTPTDALLVVRRLVAEGEPEPKVQMRFEITDTTGTSIDSVDVGDPFKLDVFVKDIRPDDPKPGTPEDDRGVWSAFLDVFYDAPLMSISGPITFGADYSGLPDQSDVGIEVTGSGNTFVDQSILTIRDDQGRTLSFEFDNDNDLSDPGHVRLEFDSSTSALQMADAIVAAVNDQTSQGNFSAEASNSGTRISVENDQQINIGSAVEGLELLIRGPGNMQIGFAPKGPGEFLLFSVPFTADAAPIDAVDDNAGTDPALNVGEDSSGVLVDVLFNDTLGGPAELRGTPAEVSPTTEVLLFYDPTTPPATPVPPEDIIYGSDALQINSPGPLLITGVGIPTDGGTAAIASGGTRVQYTLPVTSNALAIGETATDSFEYTVSDGFGTATAAVTVTIVGENDAPTAEDAGFGANEDTPLSDSLAPEASDPDTNDSLTFSGDTSSASGAAVTVNSNGTFTYDPTVSATLNALAVGETHDDTFSYTVEDGNGGSDTATVTITVTGVNDPPEAQDGSFGTDEDTPLPDTLANLASDPDTNDSLTFSGDTSSFFGAAVTVNSNGTFTYDPTASATLNALAFGQSESDTFSYTVEDGNGGSETAEVTITVDGVNDPPEAQDGSFGTDEDTAINDTLADLADDPDANDSLTFSGDTSSALGAAVTVNSNGTFTYDPTASATLNALAFGETDDDTFTYIVEDGNGGSETAEVTITVDGLNDPPEAQDGSFGTNEDTAINDTLANLADDPDLGDSLVFSNGSSSAWGASVTINPDGTFTYDPTGSSTLQAMLPGDTRDDTFSYAVSDGTASDSAEITITVAGRNDSPVAQDDDLFVDEQSVDNVLDVLSNDSDPDAGDTPTIISVGQPEHGTATAAPDGLSIIYTPDSYAPDPGYIGLDTFSYTIEDSNGATATATVTVNVEALVLPRARNDTFSVGEDSQDNDLDVLANDLITPGGTPSIDDVGEPAGGGTAVNPPGTTLIQYTPPATANALGVDETATDSFEYTVSDGFGSATATVTVTIVGENDAPTAEDAGFGANEDTPLSDSLAPEASDPDTNDSLTFSGDTSSASGAAVTVNSDGTFTYDPTVSDTLNALAVGETHDDTFDYTVDDGNGGSDTATVTITVTGANDAPTAEDAGFGTDEDTPLSDSLALEASDPDTNDSLSFSGDTSSASGAAVTVNSNGTFTYDPTVSATLNALAVGETHDDTFSYTVEDGNGGSDTAKVTITVSGMNDGPTAHDAGFDTDEDTTIDESLAPHANDPDINDSLAFSGETSSFFGAAVTVNPNGTFTYDPTVSDTLKGMGVGDSKTDTFGYTVDDGHGGSDNAAVTITVTGVNDPPEAEDGSFGTDEDTALNDTLAGLADDPEGDALTFSAGTSSTLGAAVTVNSDGTFSYDPTVSATLNALAFGETDDDTFTYIVEDGNGGSDTATVTVKVTGRNDGPTAENTGFDANEDTPLSDSLAPHASDPDSNDSLTFSGDTSSASGAAVTVDPNGTFTYDPTVSGILQALWHNESQQDQFTYTATDGGGETSSATVTINVSGVNDDPTAVPNSFSGILEDSSDNVLDVLADDFTDPESGETLSITAVGPTSAGGTVVNGTTQLTYTPKKDFFGTETFSYTIEDGHGGSDTAMVSVAVTPQNDPPTANDNGYAFVSNTGPHVLDVLANDTIVPDVGETLTIFSTSPPDQGGTVVNQGGQLLYTPPTGIQGEITETFTYEIGDGNGGTDTATVTIDVIGYFPSSLSGNVYIDTNGDGLHGSGERGIGGVEVTLTGINMFGAPVSLAATTPGDGSYAFADLVPGDYTIRSGQPALMLDGVDRIGTQGGNDSVNDQLSVSIHGIGGVVGQQNYFGEQGLQPQCYSIWDFLNSSSREGVLFAIDGHSGQLWFSFLDGWDYFTSATAEISADGSTLNMTFVDQASNTSTASVPYRESAVLHFRASEATRQLVQLVGSASDFGLTAASGPSNRAEGLTAEGEHVPDLLGGEGPASPVSRQAQGGAGSEATVQGVAAEGFALLAAPGTSGPSPGPSAFMERDLALAALAAEGELLPGASAPPEGPSGFRYEPVPDGSAGAAGATAVLPALYAAEMEVEGDPSAAAFRTSPSTGAEDRLLAVDAVLAETDGGDWWGTPFDELFAQQIGG